MAARMFSEDQLEQLRSFPEIGKDDLIRYFLLMLAEDRLRRSRSWPWTC